MSNTLFCFGFGYSAQYLARRLATTGWNIVGTRRTAETIKQTLVKANLYAFNSQEALTGEAIEYLSSAQAILISIPPRDDGDLVFNKYADLIVKNKNLKWLGYLSTTGVYGDYDGQWVDEKTSPKPKTKIAENRLKAEAQWLDLFKKHKTPVHIFRLAGIYGPGRTPMLRIQKGQGDIVIKPGHFFNRIHVEDITAVLKKSLTYPSPGEIYNICDDEPAPQADVMHFAYRLLGRISPKEIHFEEANLSEMARGFYLSNKRVKNNKIKEKLQITLKYPTYRKGLTALRYPGGFV